MNKLRSVSVLLQAALLGAVFVSIGSAQATRTWVSGVGDDANPCSRTAPCKTFAGAISKTAAGGEINCLDPGGFGTVTITKAITIDCHDVFGSVLNSGTQGIVIVAGGSDTVNLRNIEISGAGSGTNGIMFSSGAALNLDHVRIYSQTTSCVSAATTVGAYLTIHDSILSNCGSNGGVNVTASSGVLQAELERVQITNSTSGLNGRTGSYAFVKDSNFTGNTTGALQSTGGSVFHLTNNQFAGNSTGIQSAATSTIVAYGNQIFLSGTAMNLAGGTILTDGQNAVFANGANGTTSGAAPKM